jgi:trans-L-3-hydroxyproline dehydratase
MKKIDSDKMRKWSPPDTWLKITSLDTHTEGEPLRIITSGLPLLKGKTILERRRFMKDNYDHLRTALLFEPRGHADHYGCIITNPVTDDADFGVIFLHNEGYSTMCGHAIIAVTKAAVETGMIEANEPVTEIKIDSPAGLVTSYANVKGGKVESVRFINVPSYVYLKDETVSVDGIGEVNFDIAFGGAFYAFVDADKLGIKMIPENYRTLIEKGMAIKHAVMDNYKIEHPYESDLNFLYGTIFTGGPLNNNAHSRNVCIFAEGEVDRSPTGTGVSARMAIHYDRGDIGIDQEYVIESILGTTFTGSVKEAVKFADYDAVIPSVKGTAHITGRHEFMIDPDDPIKNGFILR